jgi:PKD repeat protein
MLVRCGYPDGCAPGAGFTESGAETDPAFCAAIGPGSHPASFWYQTLTAVDEVDLGATFYQGRGCTGTPSADWLSDVPANDTAWHQVTGTLAAPPGTESARFTLDVQSFVNDWGNPSALFDDVMVEDTAVPDTTPPETTIISGPEATTTSTSASFSFTASEPASFQCALDGAAFTPCGSPQTYTGLGLGTHTLDVRATDLAGNVDPTPAEQSWTIVPDAPPIASFTFACSGLRCSFAANGSYDPDGTIQGYSWTFGDGASDCCGGSPGHIYAQPGSYPVTLTVGDNAGLSTSVTQTVTVTNTPPVVAFTASCTGRSCTFNGGGSFDSDGTIQTYSWTFGDGTSATGPTAAHTYAQQGGYGISLTVTDNNGAGTTTTTTVTLITLTAHGYTQNGLEKVNLAWTGTTATSFDVYRNSAKLVTVAATTYTDTIGTLPGSYRYRICPSTNTICSNQVTITFADNSVEAHLGTQQTREATKARMPLDDQLRQTMRGWWRRARLW